MTIDSAAIATKILARINADSGSGGLVAVSPLITAAVWNQAIKSTTAPYLVYDVTLAAPIGESFTSNGIEVEVRIMAVVARDVVGMSPLDRMAAINARIYGNSAAGSGTPTYGFHRWEMSGLTGWTATAMAFQSQDAESDEDHIAITTRFTFFVTQTWSP